MLLTLLILLAAAVILAAGFIIFESHRSGVVPMPSLPSERRTVSAALLEYEGLSRITDLGSGWGGLARKLCCDHPGINIRAVEKSRIPHTVSALRSKITGCSIDHQCGSIFDLELGSGQAYITYLSGSSMKKLRSMFERDLPSGGVLVSVAFAMPGWTPAKVVRAGGILNTMIYLYNF